MSLFVHTGALCCAAELERPILPVRRTESAHLPVVPFVDPLTTALLVSLLRRQRLRGHHLQESLRHSLRHQRGHHLHILWKHRHQKPKEALRSATM